MKIVKIPVNYYQQFGVDYSLDVPGEGYIGWKKTELDFDLDRTAVVLMHATNYGTQEQVPGVFNACDFVPKAYEVGKNIMPGLLAAVRKSGMKLFHVVAGSSYSKDYPGFKKVIEIAGETEPFEQIETDPILKNLREFKRDICFPGKHNLPSYEVYGRQAKFPEEERPIGDEEIFMDETQLFKVCKKYGINHLIYIGYNINWCIMFASGGMMHISKRGIMCSTIKEAVTAVENKETARANLGKENAFWTIAVGFGFVFNLDDFTSSIS